MAPFEGGSRVAPFEGHHKLLQKVQSGSSLAPFQGGHRLPKGTWTFWSNLWWRIAVNKPMTDVRLTCCSHMRNSESCRNVPKGAVSPMTMYQRPFTPLLRGAEPHALVKVRVDLGRVAALHRPRAQSHGDGHRTRKARAQILEGPLAPKPGSGACVSGGLPVAPRPVSYTHLTLPTKA